MIVKNPHAVCPQPREPTASPAGVRRVSDTRTPLTFRPTIYDDVERHAQVTVRALDRDGAPFEMTVDGLAAICVQHELDHLLGKVFVEYLSPLKRDRIKTKMLKKTRDEQVRGR